jgi:hypothetical protein
MLHSKCDKVKLVAMFYKYVSQYLQHHIFISKEHLISTYKIIVGKHVLVNVTKNYESWIKHLTKYHGSCEDPQHKGVFAATLQHGEMSLDTASSLISACRAATDLERILNAASEHSSAYSRLSNQNKQLQDLTSHVHFVYDQIHSTVEHLQHNPPVTLWNQSTGQYTIKGMVMANDMYHTVGSAPKVMSLTKDLGSHIWANESALKIPSRSVQYENVRKIDCLCLLKEMQELHHKNVMVQWDMTPKKGGSAVLCVIVSWAEVDSTSAQPVRHVRISTLP